jgi:putative flippase GtrA
MIRQAVKFLSVGILNTLLDWAIYFGLTHWVSFFADQQVFAKGISYSIGVLNSFYWNKTWTFRSQSSSWRALLLFILSNLIGLVINSGALHICLNVLALPEVAALVLATGSSLLWNFAISKFVVFKK